ncbi:hypothetical protein LTR78_006840 [Recurvomyces mirabilis]|uniref:PSP1 C-terminal domain-containing protein n=1 Tax=Recurvomyces mirabilis TaxID=574656 RepID=A0AAE1BZB4_9PEZI|nr:hypothetical protein LTR78_006840 [Recurvomyces mirabilis]
MNSIRRGGTPESEAVASSEDERPWPSSTSFGSLPRKENGMSGLGGGIWATGNQRRGSLKLSEAAQRNAAREARLTAPGSHSALRTANTPSPSISDGQGALPFAIPLQPTPKAHRSLSHSQGQREALQAHIAGQAGGALPLGLLAEDNETEADADSDFGGHLTQTVSHPPIGALQRAATYSAAYGGSNGMGNGAGEYEDRRLQAALSQLTMDAPNRKARWESHLGWSDLPNINESRRHSLADIPTRRGSFSDDMGFAYSRDQRPSHARVPATNGLNPLGNRADIVQGDYQQHTTMRYNEDPDGFNIPSMYKVPFVDISAEEAASGRPPRSALAIAPAYGPPGSQPQRNRRQLYVVSFKCSRVGIFYLLDGTGLEIREGDIVIVEADRGQDLGTVQHSNVTQEQARLYLRKYAEEQYKWLMMFSVNNAPSNVNPNAQLYGESSAMAASRGLLASAPNTMQGMPRENNASLKPKAIKRLANAHEIKMLAEKEGNEAKAKRTCQQKVAHLHLQMEILDAEWQWDFQKLIFYYYADHYINFKDLITELYRIYKTRIWLSAVNPASFSQQAMGQPPSGIGPGAITQNNSGVNNSYTMAYGADPDPYGAIPPYRVGYDTYDPNYPSIPGVANSFAPSSSVHQAPAVQPGADTTNSMADYNFYYERGGDQRALMSPTAPTMQAPMSQQQQQMQHQLQQQQASPYGSTGYWSGMFPEYPTQVAPPTPAGAVTQPLRTNFRDFSPSPWNNANSPINPASAGLGRQGESQQPIGTRPRSNGGPGMPGQAITPGSQGDVGEDHVRQYRHSHQPAGYETQLRNFGFPFLPNASIQAGVRHNSTTGQFIGNAFETATAPANGGAAMPGPYADEMSRER